VANSFRYAANNKDLKAAFVFYGPPPGKEELERIHCPVYGFYAGGDNRITSTVAETSEQMKKLSKKYQPVTYEGAGHGFMRAGEDPTNTVPGNKTAREQGFARLVKLLKEAKSTSSATSSTSSGVLAKASATQANSCHDVNKSLAAAGTR